MLAALATTVTPHILLYSSSSLNWIWEQEFSPFDIPSPRSSPSPVKVRLLDHTIVVVALWKVLLDQQLHLLCQSLSASRISPISCLCFSCVPLLPLFSNSLYRSTANPLPLTRVKETSISNRSFLFTWNLQINAHILPLFFLRIT
jgi:hypothetical protein